VDHVGHGHGYRFDGDIDLRFARHPRFLPKLPAAQKLGLYAGDLFPNLFAHTVVLITIGLGSRVNSSILRTHVFHELCQSQKRLRVQDVIADAERTIGRGFGLIGPVLIDDEGLARRSS
jgi:hypothetical protein